MASGLISLFNEMANRKEIQKAQKAPKQKNAKKKKKKKKKNLFGELSWLLKKLFFFVLLGKVGFPKKNQLFLRKKLVFGSRGLQKTTFS